LANEPILIIDDNAVNLKLVRVLLSGEGFHVRTASSAEEALEILDTFEPRVVLMDIQLPGIDGLELTRRLKRTPKFSKLIIIAVTAYAMKGDQLKALAAGCDHYITKPIDIDTLPRVIDRMIREAVQ
jgi:two-component system cell cycle response regulator DivK